MTETGYEEAHQAGRLLREENYHFDICYTSVLKRAIHTAYTVLDELDLAWIPMVKDYHLNERHYGALQGLNKKETAEKYGGYADFSARNGIFRANVFIPLEDMDLRLSDKAG